MDCTSRNFFCFTMLYWDQWGVIELNCSTHVNVTSKIFRWITQSTTWNIKHHKCFMTLKLQLTCTFNILFSRRTEKLSRHIKLLNNVTYQNMVNNNFPHAYCATTEYNVNEVIDKVTYNIRNTQINGKNSQQDSLRQKLSNRSLKLWYTYIFYSAQQQLQFSEIGSMTDDFMWSSNILL